MLPRSLLSINFYANVSKKVIVLPCRTYTMTPAKSSRLAEINLEMKRVLDNAAVRNLTARTTVTHILKLAQELRESGESFNTETYEHILSAYAKAGDSRQTLVLYKQMMAHGINPSRTFFHKALQSAALAGDSKLQAKLLYRMEASGHYKTSKTYYYMILCMQKNMELERALDTLELMKKEKIGIGLLSYLNVIDMAIKLKHPSIAAELIGQVEDLNLLREQDQIIYLHLLRCAVLKSDYAISKLYWRKTVIDCNLKPDEGICLYMLDLAGKNGDPTMAGDVIRYIGQEGYPYRECHFVPLIDAFASTGDMKNTFQVFSAMRKVGVIPNKKTAIPIAYRLGKDKNAVRKAREALREIAENGQEVDISAFNLVIHSLAYNKEYDDAISLYARSKEFNVIPNDETLSAALDACIHCKDAELGVSIYQELLSKGVKASVSSLSKMVTLMCTQEDYDDAFKYLERMKKLNMVPLRGCYFKLVKTLSRANDPRLEMAIDDMKACGYQLSTHMDDFMLIEEEKRARASEEETNILSI